MEIETGGIFMEKNFENKYKFIGVDLAEKEEKEEQVKMTKIVTVSNCSKLRLRMYPNLDSKVIKELPVGEKLEVDASFENPEFYKVTDENGSYGYVMKNYVV